MAGHPSVNKARIMDGDKRVDPEKDATEVREQLSSDLLTQVFTDSVLPFYPGP